MKFRSTLNFAALLCSCIMFNAVFSQNVGIATPTPIAPLNVAHGKTVVFGHDSVPGNPIGPMGTLTWFPTKGALRYLHYGGGSIGGAWDPVNIGVNSLGIGQYCFASGPQSFAQGYGSYATGFYSFARGFSAFANGHFSFAQGENAYANGNFSFAFGWNYAIANADYSFVFGSEIISTGQYSAVFGEGNHAKSYGSLVIGRFNDSINSSSSDSWVNTDPVFIVGNGTGSFARSNSFIVLKNGSTGMGVNLPSAYLQVAPQKTVLFGNDSTSATVGEKFVWFGTKAALRFGKINSPSSSPWDYVNIGENSLGIGDIAQASGYNSFAQGFGVTASGSYAMARGFAASATEHSFAMGSNVQAVGPFAFGFGSGLRSVAMWTLAFGNSNTSNGQYSSTIGSDLHAKAYNCFVTGRFNDSINSSSNTTWVDADPLFLIGNGTSNAARRNAVTVLKNGKVGIGITPVYEFEITHISGSQGNMGLAIRNTNPGGSNHRWSHYVSNGTGDYLLHFNGNLRGTFDDVTGSYTMASDARLKSEIESIGAVLDDLLQLKPSRYYLIDEKYRDAKHIGFIAQDVEKLFPSLVQRPSVEQEYYTLDYSGFSVLAVKAIQEQQELIKNQQSRIEELEKRLKAIEERLK